MSSNSPERDAKAQRNVGYDFGVATNKALSAARAAFSKEMELHKPDNPRSPTYGEDLHRWQESFNYGKDRMDAVLSGTSRNVQGEGVNNVEPKELERLKEELKRANNNIARLKAQDKAFKDLERQASADRKTIEALKAELKLKSGKK